VGGVGDNVTVGVGVLEGVSDLDGVTVGVGVLEGVSDLAGVTSGMTAIEDVRVLLGGGVSVRTGIAVVAMWAGVSVL